MSVSNNRILKNSIFLYVRLIFTLGIGLYSSRIVLKVLGVEDFGIYNIVGGVVAIFSFLHTSLGSATTRFLSISMIGDSNNLKKVFNTSVVIHLLLGLLVLIFAETIGLWLVYNKLNIPDSRFQTALWVYQISIISSVITIMQIPYDAAIIAKEKMNVFAIISILEAILKLTVIFIVMFSGFDRLFYYAILILLVSIIIRIIAQVYCYRNFEEFRFSFMFDKKIFNEMIKFFSWDLFGNMSFVVQLQGFNILQNIFFGPIINASVSIVSTAQGGVSALGGNFSLAIRPQLMQAYASNDIDKMLNLFNMGTKLSFYLMLILALPIATNSEFFLKIWLGKIPPHATDFLKFGLLNSIIAMAFSFLIIIIHSTGKVNLLSILTGSVYLISFSASYFLLKIFHTPMIPYYVNLGITIMIGIIDILLVKKYISQFNIRYFVYILSVFGFILLFTSTLSTFIVKYFDIPDIVKVILVFLTTVFTIFVFGINKNEKQLILAFIKNKFAK